MQWSRTRIVFELVAQSHRIGVAAKIEHSADGTEDAPVHGMAEILFRDNLRRRVIGAI